MKDPRPGPKAQPQGQANDGCTLSDIPTPGPALSAQRQARRGPWPVLSPLAVLHGHRPAGPPREASLAPSR